MYFNPVFLTKSTMALQSSALVAMGTVQATCFPAFNAAMLDMLVRLMPLPVFEAPPLARALFKHAEVGDEVPAALYGAVAEVLAWVFQLRRQMPGSGRVQAPRDISVPPGLDPAETLQ